VLSPLTGQFSWNLADNIRYQRPEASDAEVRRPRERQVGARTGPAAEGMRRRSVNRALLSVGERQRLQLARALVAAPRILILDEATANLDYVTEFEVKRAMTRLQQGRTTFVIAHRYSMVQDADFVVVL
jgi:ABC-type multidrug transport system fused ATPase/permease subunit